MEIMIAQMKALSARTEILEQAKMDGAKAVPVPGGGGHPGVPSVSSGLPLFAGPPATAFSKYTSLVGPPPKVRAPIPSAHLPAASSTQAVPVEAEDPNGLAAALSQQSTAVLALVSHLASQSDPLGDIPGVSAHSTSVKGVQKREKMQQDLAMGSSAYYLQVMQQLHKKLYPSLPLPKTTDELGHLSVLTYLERSGGFKQHREAGLRMWVLSHTVDAAAQGDLHQVRERLALMTSVIGGRSPDLPFPRSVEHYGTFWETVWEPGTPSMVIGRPCLYKRNGGLGEQEARIPQKESKDDRSRQSIAEKKGKISKASSSRSGCCEGTIDGSHEGIQKSGGNVPVAAGCRDKLHADAAGLRNDLFGKHISFASWCAQMVASVFRTRTSFSAFARSAIHLTRSTEVSRSPAFPIPLPHVGVFDRMPSGLSLHHRSQIHFKRAVVLTILALDFWWSGNRFIDLDLLRRSPSVSQRQIIKRVVDFMQVDGPKIPFSVSLSGRRSPQLIARLCELSDAGVKNSPYDRTFEGFESEVPVDNSILPELEPYRSLDFSRLRVVGEGHFNPIPFLDDNLCMAFCNPDSLLHPVLPDKENLPCIRDPLEQIVGLMKLWDCRGLLLLHEHNTPGLYPHECVRIFNCFKSVECDRQIGDRRGRNFCERRLHGPSKLLPAGPDVFELFLEVGEQVHVSVSDRRDFYHQFSTTYSRAISNTLSPGVPAELVSDTAAFSALILRKANQSSSRHCVGDGLFASRRFPKVTKKRPSLVFGAFKSILQGDHGGVEFACQSHENLLRSGKLLGEDVRIVADRPFRGDSLMQGLVIDDFFAVSKVPRGTVGETPDVKAIRKAIQIYDQEKIIGSPSKDVFGERSAKVIGAHINGSDRALDRGICPLGTPATKRYALAWITLQVCALPFTTDVLHVWLLGGWISLLTLRRPLMSVLGASFRLVDSSAICPLKPRLVKLTREVANELTVLALLVCMAVSDLRAEASPWVFATDASMKKGAICKATIDKEFSKILWRTSRSKGAYHRLLTPLQALSRRLELLEEFRSVDAVPVSRPVAFCYDFLEVFSGAATVSQALLEKGFVVGPPIDISVNEEYNMQWVRVISWITFMISEKRLCAIMCEPPCTSFSIMRRPALRSKLAPYGFRPKQEQTFLGNLLACRSLQILRVALINGASAILETPFSALTKHLPPFQAMLGSPRVSMCRTVVCLAASI